MHTDAAGSSDSKVLSALARTGLFSAAEHLEHQPAYTVASVSCFAAALLLPYAAGGSLLPAATAALLAKAALTVTYVLSGLPQLAETLFAAVAGKIDTHVLMSLSVLGTLYMGLAQEVRVLIVWSLLGWPQVTAPHHTRTHCAVLLLLCYCAPAGRAAAAAVPRQPPAGAQPHGEGSGRPAAPL
jgi:cation transport ATPase